MNHPSTPPPTILTNDDPDVTMLSTTTARALSQRALLSLTTLPDATGWKTTVVVTLATTATSGLVAVLCGFVDPIHDYDPPWRQRQSSSPPPLFSIDGTENSSTSSGSQDMSSSSSSSSRTASSMLFCTRAFVKPLSAFVFPSFVEEFIWRGLLIPHPSSKIAQQIVVSSPGGGHITAPITVVIAMTVLLAHVLSHPVVGWTVWPRGRQIFDDPRFLVLATIVLGGATYSYVVTGGSVWAATITHGLPVMLWRDFFGGESKLLQSSLSSSSSYGSMISKEKDM